MSTPAITRPSRTAIEAITAYQRLLDLASEAEEEGLVQALEDVAAGRVYPDEEIFCRDAREAWPTGLDKVDDDSAL
jgi:hypothetical protein